MGFPLAKFNAPCDQFCIWNGGFTEDEIEKIVFLENLLTFEKGLTGPLTEPNVKIRDSEISWIVPDMNSDWIFQRFASIIGKINYDHFLYNIDWMENLQYTKYGENGHYEWHLDVQSSWQNFQRKISAVMLLNNPDEYEGGEFEIVTNGLITEPKSWKPNKGDIVFFASTMPHRVKPVLSGERKSIVTWIMGKRDC